MSDSIFNYEILVLSITEGLIIIFDRSVKVLKPSVDSHYTITFVKFAYGRLRNFTVLFCLKTVLKNRTLYNKQSASPTAE